MAAVDALIDLLGDAVPEAYRRPGGGAVRLRYMSDKVGQNLTALLTASMQGDGVEAVQIWRDLDVREKEDVAFLLISFLEAQRNLTAELMEADPKDYQNALLFRARERYAQEDE